MNSTDDDRINDINNLVSLFEAGEMSIVIPRAIELIREYQNGTAYNILALAHKRLGNYSIAQGIYEKLLVLNPKDSRFLTNLGNIYQAIGKLDKAEEMYNRSLVVQPQHFETSISLGDVFLNTSRLDQALSTLKLCIKTNNEITPEQCDRCIYKIAEIYRKKGNLFVEEAIHYYSLSNQPLSREHKLELIYVSKDRSTYFEAEEGVNTKGEINPLLASIQTHASIRYGTTDVNLFCKDPFQYIYHSKLTLGEGFDDNLVNKLLELKDKLSSSSQVLLKNGQQSAGDFLLSNDPSVQLIKNIILNRINSYRDKHSNSNDGFIKSWPQNSKLHGWIIDIKKGGSLESHMHKLGWLSGSLYLQLKKPYKSNQGNIVFDLKGATYPCDSKKFPSKEFHIEKGDIVLFPSSIFHKTIPFNSSENRITLAFDVKPI